MGLSFGFKALDIRESIWKGDDALVGVPAAALAAWEEDGDATHLAPYATAGEASKITFRNLNPDETRLAQAPFADAASGYEGYVRSLLLCFRIGVDFPDAPEKFEDDRGVKHPRTVRERGIRMLSMDFVAHLDAQYPSGKDIGIVAFYGGLIHAASFATDAEKKASSPPSTPKQSSAEASTAGTTAPPPSEGAATAVP